MSSWADIFCHNAVEIFSNGILRDIRQDFGQGQRAEYEMRESVAKHFIGKPEEALLEATHHHSYCVMRKKAYRAIKFMLSRQERQEDSLLVDLGCGFGWHWVDIAKIFPSIRFLMIDFSMANLLLCRSLMPFKDYPNVLCLHTDIMDIPLNERICDFCWSVQALQHLPPVKRIAVFKEIV